ncbi:MAG: hypothetical protein PGN34_20750 [Methylobacterium frigidaeris]
MTGRTTPIAVLTALVLAGPLAAEPATPPWTGAKLPADVGAVATRLRGCGHWTGEDSYDAARGRAIAAAVKRLRCDALDEDEARLRRRYRRDPAALKALDAARDAGG